jgi:hypothetical protein
MRLLLVLVGFVGLFVGCDSSLPPPEATGPVDWARVADEQVPRIVTRDPDGTLRVTKLGLVVVDGGGYIRTRGTRWLANIERDPDVVLWIGAAAHPLRAEQVSDPALATRILDAFSEKYGFLARVVRWFNGDKATLLQLVERPAP